MSLNTKTEFPNTPMMAFNMAALWFLELDKLQMEKYQAIITRDAITYFCIVDCIYTHVFMKIPVDKRDKMAKELKEVYKNVLVADRSSPKQKSYNRLKGFELCKELDRNLILILHQQKLFFPDINFNFGLGKVRDRYGLDDKKE